MSGEHGPIEASYAHCRRVARSSGSNFYRTFLMLGRAKRRAMDAIYAFMRHTDDLGDSDDPLATRKTALAQWRVLVCDALAGRLPRGVEPSLLPALVDTVERFKIPSECLLAVLDGVQMDLDQRCYETFAELAEYCRCVASAVGRACIQVWGFEGEEALEAADKCGLALQLTNILRDLREDVRQGRIYLPQEELRRWDYSASDLVAGIADERFLQLMQFQVDRAEQFYREGVGLFARLYPDGQRIFGMMMAVYHEILHEIRRDPAAVLSRRVSLGRLQKTRITARWLLLPPRSPILT